MMVWQWAGRVVAALMGLAAGWELGLWQTPRIPNEIVGFGLSLVVYLAALIAALGTMGIVQVLCRTGAAGYSLGVIAPYLAAWQQAVDLWGTGGAILGLLSLIPLLGLIGAGLAVAGRIEICPGCGEYAFRLIGLRFRCPYCRTGVAANSMRQILQILQG